MHWIQIQPVTRRGLLLRRRALVLVLASVAVVALVLSSAASRSSSPFSGLELYTDVTYRPDISSLDRAQQRAVSDMLDQPQGIWVGEWTTRPQETVASVLADATRLGQVPLFVIYAIPGRDCGGQSEGGSESYDDYQSLLADIALGLGSSRAVVVLEPDALAQLDCLEGDRRRLLRLEALREAVDRLAALPNVTTYIDAGHSQWVEPRVMADRLASVGVSRVRGFSLNVSNFNPTTDEARYGMEIGDALGGVPFVVDTSRNGAGPWSGEDYWCNPPGRALGVPPLTPTAHPNLDAVLWIKRPGVSDGACRPGNPAAGVFWPEYAADLASRTVEFSADQRDSPRLPSLP